VRKPLALVLALSLVACSRAVTNTIDDAATIAAVKTVLLNAPDLPGWNIDVEAVQGVVTLSGVVRSASEQQRAIELVRSVEGVKDVRSQLQTTPTPQF
jgi:hyperosmotically inducible protein